MGYKWDNIKYPRKYKTYVMASLMWDQDWEFIDVPCDSCVKSTTYLNRDRCVRKCGQCGSVMEL